MNRIRRVIIGDKYLTSLQYTCHRKERKCTAPLNIYETAKVHTIQSYDCYE